MEDTGKQTRIQARRERATCRMVNAPFLVRMAPCVCVPGGAPSRPPPPTPSPSTWHPPWHRARAQVVVRVRPVLPHELDDEVAVTCSSDGAKVQVCVGWWCGGGCVK
jgi:hypothetical protein